MVFTMTDWQKVAEDSWEAPTWRTAARESKGPIPYDDAKPASIEQHQPAAGNLIDCPDILHRFGAEVENAGLVGEASNAKILYLALTSRLFERPVSIAIKGVSSVGKSFTVEQVLKFFPPRS